MESVTRIIQAIVALAPQVLPLVTQLIDAILGHQFTAEEVAKIRADLDAAKAQFDADVARREAEGEGG